MALNRKYAALPDLDSAPDIYETPELTDGVSTVPTTTVQSHSDHDFDEDDDDTPGISRSRLRINDARNKFEPSKVDARDVDFSDRLDSKRKSYKVSSRRRILKGGVEQLGDLSDEDDDENLDRKVARLKRELEEVKDEVGRKARIAQNTDERDLDQLEELDTLSSAIDEISLPVVNRTSYRTVASGPPLATSAANQGDNDGKVDQPANATYTITYAPTYQQSHALMKAADFDKRLLELEKAIGIGSSALPELESNALPRAIIPTLDMLQKQIGTLGQASVSSLDSMSRRARILTQDAEDLTKARQLARQAQEALDETQVPQDDPASESSEQATKINALYGTLATIENISPLLPPLLDRLRSLRTIHSEAAGASQTLDNIDKRQVEMAEDIRLWKEGLDNVETAMKNGEENMTANKSIIEGWVKDLEERMADLE